MNDSKQYTFYHTLSQIDMDRFLQLSGDDNPVHQDPIRAQQMGFDGPIGYGMLAGIYFSTLIGKYLPGHGAIYLSQTLKFHKPLLVGERLAITGSVVQQNPTLGIMHITTTIHDAKKVLLVSGEAVVKVPKKI